MQSSNIFFMSYNITLAVNVSIFIGLHIAASTYTVLSIYIRTLFPKCSIH